MSCRELTCPSYTRPTARLPRPMCCITRSSAGVAAGASSPAPPSAAGRPAVSSPAARSQPNSCVGNPPTTSVAAACANRRGASRAAAASACAGVVNASSGVLFGSAGFGLESGLERGEKSVDMRGRGKWEGKTIPLKPRLGSPGIIRAFCFGPSLSRALPSWR